MADRFEIGMMALFVAGFTAIAFKASSPDVGIYLDTETKDLAKYGRVTPDQVCDAQAQFSTNLDNYFKAHAEGTRVNPTLTITKGECMDLMAKKAPAPTPGS